MLWFGFRNSFKGGVENSCKGNWVDRNGLLHQAEEQLPAAFRSPSIESERELIQVVIEMLVADGPLVGSHEPSLEKRDDSMDARQQFRSGLLAAFDDAHLVKVSLGRHAAVAGPAIGMQYAAPLDGVHQKPLKGWGRGVCNLAHTDPSDPHSIFLSCNGYQRFLLNQPTA